MGTIIYILVSISTFTCCLILYHIIFTYYKEREWQINNPDEHEIMNRKIKDDFSRKNL